MQTDIIVEQQNTQHTLEIAVRIPLFKIPKVLGDCFPRIKQHIEASDSKLAGAPYARYLNIDWEVVRKQGMLGQIWQLLTHKQPMRIGMPVASAAGGTDEIQPSEITAGEYVKTIHVGPYHKVGETYKRIAEWAAKQNIVMADNSIESYFTDPGEVPAEELQTLILIPVA